jgi:neutral ceramidase
METCSNAASMISDRCETPGEDLSSGRVALRRPTNSLSSDRSAPKPSGMRTGARLLRAYAWAVWVVSTAGAATDGVRAGFAERDITPSIGMERPGGYGKVLHTRFHDPCKVRAAVFDDGKRKVAIVGVDALFVPRTVVLNARIEIEKLAGIPGNAVMISATHSHSSGPVGMVQPGQFDDAPEEIRRLAYEESSLANPGYLLRATHEIVQAVRAAESALVPAQLGFGFGHEDKAAFNRRMRMKNGQTWTMPGATNPDIVGYAGPIDPQVGVIGAWNANGTLIGTLVTFACHATTSPGGISANWIYYMERTLQGAMDSRAPVVFLAGPCGDVGQVDSLSPNEYRTGNAWAQFIGGRVGAEAAKVLLSVPRGGDVPLDARQKVWTIQRRSPSAQTVANARAIVARGKRPPDLSDWLFAKETLMLTHLLAREPSVEIEVQAIQIGPALCVSNPAEYFVSYGLEIKKRSKFPFTFPVELANGCVGYVPTEEAFSPSGGGYETRLTFYSNLETTAGRQIAEASIALANDMTPGPVPDFPKIKTPGQPWPYGNVKPGLD